MGRELKRVDLDFKWPIDQLWKGYVNPYRSQDCNACDNTGLNPATKKLKEEWYGWNNPTWVWVVEGKVRYNSTAREHNITQVELDALLKAERLRELTHTWDKEDRKWIPTGHVPTIEEVNKWSLPGQGTMGHDSSNAWIATEALAKHKGVYGLCDYCNGDGEIWASEEIKQLHENWEPFDPPKGEGYQIWSTTTEGHPMTPVFPSLEALCEYASTNVTTFGTSHFATKEQWMKMLGDDGFAHHQEGNMIFI